MGLHIGNQQAGVINNAGRDQRISGGQKGTLVASAECLHAAEDLRAAVAATPLDHVTRATAEGELDVVDAELSSAAPDRHRVATSLERLTRLLTAAGALATAGQALAGPLTTLAGWLGGLGAPVLALLA
jgi:hypothetical protein